MHATILRMTTFSAREEAKIYTLLIRKVKDIADKLNS